MGKSPSSDSEVRAGLITGRLLTIVYCIAITQSHTV